MSSLFPSFLYRHEIVGRKREREGELDRQTDRQTDRSVDRRRLSPEWQATTTISAAGAAREAAERADCSSHLFIMHTACVSDRREKEARTAGARNYRDAGRQAGSRP